MAGAQEPGRIWARKYLDAWETHDGSKVAEFVTDDVVYIDIGLGDRLDGADAVRDLIDEMATAFSTDFRFTLGQVVYVDNAYALEWTMSGTNDRANPKRGLPATGQSYEIPGVSIGRLRDGKIVENRDYWNLAAYLMQVGLMPQPE